MARGSTSSQGRVAKSELSERLRAKAESLRRENEAENKEVEQTNDDYNNTVEQERIRIEEEVMREMKDRKWSVDREAQAKREAEAKLAEAAAKAEEEREDAIKTEWAEINNDRIDFSIKKEKAVLADYLPRPFAVGNNNEQGKNLNRNLYVPWSFSGSYERKMIEGAPKSIRAAVETFFEAHADDQTGIEDALTKAYESSIKNPAFLYDPYSDEPELPKNIDELPSRADHKVALKNVERAEKYIRKILKNAKKEDMRFDEDGNERP
jgi:hypothetical protein